MFCFITLRTHACFLTGLRSALCFCVVINPETIFSKKNLFTMTMKMFLVKLPIGTVNNGMLIILWTILVINPHARRSNFASDGLVLMLVLILGNHMPIYDTIQNYTNTFVSIR